MTSLFGEGLRDLIGVMRMEQGGGFSWPILGGGATRAEFGTCRSPPTLCRPC